jgi:chromosome partitioning protein
MGKIIMVASQKGGVGKTTVSFNLAYNLGKMGNSVLLLDGDPQGGIAIASNLRNKTKLGILDIILGRCTYEEAIQKTKNGFMSVLGIGELSIEDVFNIEDKARSGELGTIIKEIAEKFNYIIIDTPAGIGTLVSSFMQISDELIMVINCKTFSLKTLPLFLKTIKDVKTKYNNKLELNGVIINMFKNGNELEKDILTKIKKVFPREVFYNTIIPYSDYFEKASMYSIPISMLTRRNNASKPFLELAMELKERETKNIKGGNDEEPIMGLF